MLIQIPELYIPEVKVPLTRDFILSQVSEEEIYRAFIPYDFKTGRKILSPLRDERSPSFTIKRGDSGVLYFKDWGSGQRGDCFDLVKELYQCDFSRALNLIAERLHIRLTQDNISKAQRSPLPRSERKAVQSKVRTEIVIQEQPMSLEDIKYWKRFGISQELLKKAGIKACRKVWINGRIYAKYTWLNPIYAYDFGNGIYKIYMPFSDKAFKWRTNILEEDDMLQGEKLLPDRGELLIWTKGYKDVLTLKELNYVSVAPSSEGGTGVSETKINELKDRFTHIYILYDNDNAGYRGSFRLHVSYGMPRVFLPNHDLKGNTLPNNVRPKDISDWRAAFGENSARDVLEKIIR